MDLRPVYLVNYRLSIVLLALDVETAYFELRLASPPYRHCAFRAAVGGVRERLGSCTAANDSVTGHVEKGSTESAMPQPALGKARQRSEGAGGRPAALLGVRGHPQVASPEGVGALGTRRLA